MLESYADLKHQPREALATLLVSVLIDIRQVLAHPEMPNHLKVAGVFAIVDAAAPPPPPERGEEAARAARSARTAVTHLAASS
jgi:hypothetical protein